MLDPEKYRRDLFCSRNKLTNVRKCFNLGCDVSMKVTSPTIECRKGCGVIYCSMECEESHWTDDSHYLGCFHISSARKRERFPLLDTRVIACGLISRPELNGRAGFATAIVGDRYSVKFDDDPKSLLVKPTNLTEECPLGTELPSQTEEARAIIEANMRYPACVDVHGISKRRFRVGQRVQCNHGSVASPVWLTGTVVTLTFGLSNQQQPLPYDIELDNGDFCSAPRDDDSLIRRVVGTPVVADTYPLPAVVTDTMSWCDEDEHGSGHFTSRLIDKSVCSHCGKQSAEGLKLSVCSRCKSASYCSRECQLADFPSHKKPCKVAAECLEFAKQELPQKSEQKLVARTLFQRKKLIDFLVSTNLPEEISGFIAHQIGDAMGDHGHDTGGCGCLRCAGRTSVYLARAIDEGIVESSMGARCFTSDNFLRLRYGAAHFKDKDRETAAHFATGVSIFSALSLRKPLLPTNCAPEYPAPKDARK